MRERAVSDRLRAAGGFMRINPSSGLRSEACVKDIGTLRHRFRLRGSEAKQLCCKAPAGFMRINPAVWTSAFPIIRGVIRRPALGRVRVQCACPICAPILAWASFMNDWRTAQTRYNTRHHKPRQNDDHDLPQSPMLEVARDIGACLNAQYARRAAECHRVFEYAPDGQRIENAASPARPTGARVASRQRGALQDPRPRPCRTDGYASL